jgi:hypothetical protein
VLQVVFDSGGSSLAGGGLESPGGVGDCDLVTGKSFGWWGVAGAAFRSPLLFPPFSLVTLLSFALLSFALLSFALLSFALLSFALLSFALLSFALLSFALLSFALLSFAGLSLALLFFDSCRGSEGATSGGNDFALGCAGACRTRP